MKPIDRFVTVRGLLLVWLAVTLVAHAADSPQLTFTVKFKGSTGQTLMVGDEENDITMNAEGTLTFVPYQIDCDGTRFVSKVGRVTGTVRFWGKATAPWEEHGFDHTITSTVPFIGQNVTSAVTPTTADYLYFKTLDSVYCPPDEDTLYGIAYDASERKVHLWVCLAEPFSYPAEFEHYEFAATHTASNQSTARSWVFGTVVDSGSRAPLSGATVVLGGVSTTTDGQGGFRFQQVPPTGMGEAYALTVSKPRYLALTESLAIPGLGILRPTIALRPDNNLAGRVVRSDTQDGISGAIVTLGAAYSTTTDSEGAFQIKGIASGTYELTIRATGFAPYVGSITFPSTGPPDRTFALTPLGQVAVVSLSSRYPGFVHFLRGVEFPVEFETWVAWAQHRPGQIEYTMGPTRFEMENSQGERNTKRFDVGTQFDVGGTLRVSAVSLDGTVSVPRRADFIVIPPPWPMLEKAPFKRSSVGSDSFSYNTTFGGNLSFFDQAMDDQLVPPEDIPFFGGLRSVVSFMPELACEIDPNGRAEFNLEWGDLPGAEVEFLSKEWGREHNAGKMCRLLDDLVERGRLDRRRIPKAAMWGREFKIFPILDCEYQYNDSSLAWDLEVFKIGLAGEAGLSFSRPFLVGWVPVFAKANGTLRISGETVVRNVTSMNMGGQLEIEASARGTVGVGIDEFVSMAGWIEGNYSIGWEWSETPRVAEQSATVKAGLVAHALGYVQEDAFFEWKWPQTRGLRIISRQPGGRLGLLDRDYLRRPHYSRSGTEDSVAFRRAQPGPNDNETASIRLLSNVYPYSAGKLAAVGTNLLFVYLHDDPARAAQNRTVLVTKAFDGEKWNDASPVEDDGTADFHPELKGYADGSACVSWENLAAPLGTAAAFTNALAGLEISASTFDPVMRRWRTAVRLTANGYLDRSPKVSGPDGDDILLAWVSNEANDPIGAEARPNQIWITHWDGRIWSTAIRVAEVRSPIMRYDLTYDGTNACMVLSLDTDGDLSTVSDHELFRLSGTPTRWGPLERLTNDQVPDDSPRLLWRPSEGVELVWVRTNEISQVKDFDFSRRLAIWTDEYSANLADFRLCVAEDRMRALWWCGPSEFRSDLWVMFYDPQQRIWGRPRQMTFDDQSERDIAGAFLSYGDWVAVYNRQLVMPSDPGGSAETDLIMLQHPLRQDLALDQDSFRAWPANPRSGEQVSLELDVLNQGDRAVADLPVSFFNGDPSAGGVEIGRTNLAQPLPAWGRLPIRFTWQVPTASRSLALRAIVDPDKRIQETSRSNNVARLSLLAPELAISSIWWQRVGTNQFSISATVTNSGAIASSSAALEWRLQQGVGPVLDTLQIPPLDPGQMVTLTWQVGEANLTLSGDVWISIAATDASQPQTERREVRLRVQPVGPTLPLALGPVVKTADGAFRVGVQNGTRRDIVIESSSNLREWMSVTNFGGLYPAMNVVDPGDSNGPPRFYRGRVTGP